MFRYTPDLRHDLELSENRRKKLKKDLVKLEKRLDETPKFIPIYDPVLREKDRRYQQGKEKKPYIKCCRKITIDT